jgi:hypothetical protein
VIRVLALVCNLAALEAATSGMIRFEWSLIHMWNSTKVGAKVAYTVGASAEGKPPLRSVVHGTRTEDQHNYRIHKQEQRNRDEHDTQ